MKSGRHLFGIALTTTALCAAASGCLSPAPDRRGSEGAPGRPREAAYLPKSPAACENLASLKWDNATIASATSLAAGQPVAGAVLPPIPGLGTGGPVKDVPAFCRVIGALHPEAGSDIGFEVWLPLQGWDGRLNGAGNGGFAGSISYMELAQAIRAGQVGASTDTGHKANGIDAGWAKDHPERVRDYGWRAIHETTVIAKRLSLELFGRTPHHSYFVSCSNGGRQGLMEAARFPDDYDGIVAGAPASSFTQLATSMLWTVRAQSAEGAQIKASQAAFLRDEVVRQCDALDGQTDEQLRAASNRAVQSMRLYMVPGMQHCFGGTGSANFGQNGAPEPSADPASNVAAAMQDWVERGRAPTGIVGRIPNAPNRQRLICAYPAQARLKPGADPDLAQSYTCK